MHILLRANPGKAAVLEEFLHGTQARLGITQRRTLAQLELHVNDFMIRHRKLLGLSDCDVAVLMDLRQRDLVWRMGGG